MIVSNATSQTSVTSDVKGNDQRSTWFHICQHRSDTRSTLDNEFYIISDLAVVASLSDVADG